MDMKNPATSIDEFIARFPPNIQAVLQELRTTIQQAAPEAKEKISYGIPTFTLGGNLVHFSAYEKHIGFYPGSGPVAEFANELKAYETSKGTVRFPLDKPLPLELIRKMTLFAIQRNLARGK
jgi:uncharacterized protein YdhG (YjbR/CyaY superfamily)